MIRRLVIALLLVLLCFGTEGTFAADASNGETLAKRWCSVCHLVEPNQNGPTTEAPPFVTIAKRPHFSAEELAFFLLDPHPKMPNMQLKRTEAENIAAYIETLK